MNRNTGYRLLWLVALAILALTIASCQQGAPPAEPPEETGPAPAGETTEETTGGAEEQAPVAPAGEPADEGPYEGNLEALDDLDSYVYEYTWSWEGGSAGAFESATFEGSGEVLNRPFAAQHVIWSSTDAAGASSGMEWIIIDQDGQAGVWFREAGGEWLAMPEGADPGAFGGLSLTGFFGAFVFSSPDDLGFVGTETVNGVLARHYRSSAFSYLIGLGCAVAEAADEVWEAVDGGFPVKQTSRFSGACGGESAEWTYDLDVTGINQPVDITPPI